MATDNPSLHFSTENRLKKKNFFFPARALGEKRLPQENHVRLGTKEGTSQIQSHVREWGPDRGSGRPKRKVVDDFYNPECRTAELFPGRLTSGPRTGGVFSKHTVIYVSHMSQEHLKENQLII